ncbi:MAG: tRNA (adenosine(37)-N6)-dimethylallyltransferase MiaA [Clostridia bacterium]|nr:tRNA (adenosine(37)-N6)-dimethylallyltransferase MiaA [Clostridia bacterium]
MSKIKTVFVVGPTASGKTALSIELAKSFGGEIVSADSMQIYKGIHIASAAPDEDEKQGIKHHLLEFLSTDEQYSVADYVISAKEVIEDINSRGKLPIIVGGTGLYISSLLENTEFLDVETDFNLRKELEELYDTIGGEEMLKKLAEFDADSAEKLHFNDKKRIVRAFEVYRLAGKTKTEQNELSHKTKSNLNPLILGVTYNDRELLYDRINRRVDIMCRKGLLEEAENTYKSGNNKGGFQAIGHKELYGYFNNECSLEQAKENLKQQTRRYAKRQLTWFRRNENINWLYQDETDNILEKAKTLVENFLREE